MSCYETVFIARQDISAKQMQELAENFEKIINDNGAKIARTEHWGLRTMAYKINKNRKGHYALFHIEGDHAAVAEMERLMRLNEDVLRYMTVSLDETPKENTIIMQALEGGSSNDDDKHDKRGARR